MNIRYFVEIHYKICFPNHTNNRKSVIPAVAENERCINLDLNRMLLGGDLSNKVMIEIELHADIVRRKN